MKEKKIYSKKIPNENKEKNLQRNLEILPYLFA